MLANPDPTFGHMKKAYQLELDLQANPDRVTLTQALTLNAAKPSMGLLGNRGLFGSDEWWASIANGAMPLKFVSGVITRAYQAGQDGSGRNDMIELVASDGSSESVGIYVNDEADITLFRPGHGVSLVYALDELKPGAAKVDRYSKIALEMAVTPQPVR